MKEKEFNLSERRLILVAILCSVILYVIIGFAILSNDVEPIAKLSFLLCFGLWGVGVGMIILMSKIQRGG
jgi:hypothetical protein